jgi:PIN domain nuclease of toxin-antitoxin system
VKYLLDTHVLLWFLREPEKLPSHVLAAIEGAETQTAVSVVSLLEIAIKTSLNKLSLPKPFDELFPVQ